MTKKHLQEGNAIVIGIVLLAVVGIGGYMLLGTERMPEADTSEVAMDADADASQTGEAMDGDAMEADSTPTSGDAMTADTGDAMEKEAMEGDAMVGEAMEQAPAGDAMEAQVVRGTYEEYSPDMLSRAENGDVVLFFHAKWCPTCRSADKNLSDATVPDGLTVLKADYDNEDELKRRYGVTTQHTFVQVDAEGNLIKKWSGSRTVDDIQKQLN
jgi:thioredoxin 1